MAKPETNYLIRGFRAEMQRVLTPRLADPLYNSALVQLRQLLAERRGPDGRVSPLLEKQLLPAVAVYRVMCTAIPRQQALEVVRTLIAERSARTGRLLRGLMKPPGFFRAAPWVIDQLLASAFHPDDGFQVRNYEVTGRKFYLDVLCCPCLEVCTDYGCPELCAAFCAGHDAAYGGLHPRLHWRIAKTLAAGDDCCDFGLRLN